MEPHLWLLVSTAAAEETAGPGTKADKRPTDPRWRAGTSRPDCDSSWSSGPTATAQTAAVPTASPAPTAAASTTRPVSTDFAPSSPTCPDPFTSGFGQPSTGSTLQTTALPMWEHRVWLPGAGPAHGAHAWAPASPTSSWPAEAHLFSSG